MATRGLIDDVPEDLPARRSFSGWEQLVMGSHAWREIVFGALSPRLLPEGCSCTEDYCVKNLAHWLVWERLAQWY